MIFPGVLSEFNHFSHLLINILRYIFDRMYSVSLGNWLSVLAILSGPFIGVIVTRYHDDRKESRERKLDVFWTLIATFKTPYTEKHLEALNKIYLHFHEKTNKKVLDASEAYLDYLNLTEVDIKDEQRNQLLIKLLYHMGLALDYNFSEKHINKILFSQIS